MAFVLYLVVVFSGTFSYKKMENMLTNAIQAEVEAWNWSQRFVPAKFQPAKTANNISVPAQPKFYKWPTHETDVKSSLKIQRNSVILYI